MSDTRFTRSLGSSFDLQRTITNASYQIGYTLQPVVDLLQQRERNILDLQLKLLNREDVIRGQQISLDERTKERDELQEAFAGLERTQESLQQRAKDDRAGFAELKRTLADERKEAQEECARERINSVQLLGRIEEMEIEKSTWAGEKSKLTHLENISKSLTNNLQISESARVQLQSNNQELLSRNEQLRQHNSILKRDHEELRATNTKWDADYRELKKKCTGLESDVKHLDSKLRDHRKNIHHLEEDLAERDQTVQELKSRMQQSASLLNLDDQGGSSRKRSRTSRGYSSYQGETYSVQPPESRGYSSDRAGTSQDGPISPSRDAASYSLNVNVPTGPKNTRLVKGVFKEVQGPIS